MTAARARPEHLALVASPGFADYRLLDSGSGRKLERFGAIVVDRPEPQALWSPSLDEVAWGRAHAVFSAAGEDDEKGRWRVDKPVPDSWPIAIAAGQAKATVLCRLSAMWHLGLFPEQAPHWEWMVRELCEARPERPRVLNLFGYTGAASLLAAAAGAEVTHLDASKKAVQWGRENQTASRHADAPIRWIVDDARKFAAREVRRGRQYDVILVDPPKFGRGPEGEVWDLFADLPALLADCVKLLAPGRAAIILTVYAIRASAIAFDQLLREHIGARGGRFETGELAILEESGARAVPTSLFTRWTG
ncbi:MAG TPA: class I SAM-dependent methyltransferase [Hyphomicrobiaceae bacterium]|nr:class I SAM-dependent methyltransferase [Hyphomicrobiaceae bacterium]